LSFIFAASPPENPCGPFLVGPDRLVVRLGYMFAPMANPNSGRFEAVPLVAAPFSPPSRPSKAVSDSVRTRSARVKVQDETSDSKSPRDGFVDSDL
jgi:hypothetical protein